MKKSVYILLIVVVLAVLGSLLLPGEYRASRYTVVERPLAPVERMMVYRDSWKKWWPGNQLSDSVFDFYGTPLTIKTMLINGFTATDSPDPSFELQCTWLPAEKNTVSLTVTAVEKTGDNPLKKIAGLVNRFSLHKHVEDWIASVKGNLENDRNIYGFRISKTRVKDPSLISTKRTFDHFPGTNEIYAMIGDLQSYIGSQQAKATNFPILHIHPVSDSSFEAMVAIATDKLLPSKDKYSPKSMVLGFLLEGEVTGGAKSTWEAEKMIERYALDYRKASPAISFQMLVTDRLKEPDTTKWVTRLYYPVFD